ncbi:uncharacterized protein SOCE26_044860 [Sorangium cellulosum]|uniref:Integral membrane protein n=1 Tax=Sorangium cellulosum TaxID=56 RepID=A0A2L0EUR8_SORCE|nr:DUF975 family protein [Sorangium cellulosum]AUX43046.1 uncharacterized protein SOCE26_044860 [Sorangium cellulosum]
MDYVNPYAPPQANIHTITPEHAGAPIPWSPGEVLSEGWTLVKRHWPALVIGLFIVQILSMIPGQVSTILKATGAVDDTTATVIGLPLSLIGMIIGVYLQGGVIKMYLTAVRGGTPQLGDIFSGGATTGRLILASLLTGFAILGGMLALIVGAFIVAFGFMLAPYFVVDAGRGPVEAMRDSWRAMKGNKGKAFVLSLALFGVALLGLLACGVGLFVAMAVGQAAFAIVYTRISGRTAPARL